MMAKLNTTGTPKRGRGRPPKNPVAASSPAPEAAGPAKRGPGRPRKSLEAEVVSSPKKSPGRPPKKLHWTQKLKQEVERSRTGTDTEGEAGSVSTEAPKRGPGRPKRRPVKDTTISQESKATAVESDDDEVEDAVEIQSHDAGEGPSEESTDPPKRGRGRPKTMLADLSASKENIGKAEEEQAEADSDEETFPMITELAETQKRGRGRPKRTQPEAAEPAIQGQTGATAVEEENADDEAEQDTVAVQFSTQKTETPKRGRGRPPTKKKGIARAVKPGTHNHPEDEAQDQDNAASNAESIRLASSAEKLDEETADLHSQLEAAAAPAAEPAKRSPGRPKNQTGKNGAKATMENLQIGGKRKATTADGESGNDPRKKMKKAASDGVTPGQDQLIAPIAPIAPMHSSRFGIDGHRSSQSGEVGLEMSADNLGEDIFNAIGHSQRSHFLTPTPHYSRRDASVEGQATQSGFGSMTGVETEASTFVSDVHNARAKHESMATEEADDEGDGGTDSEHQRKLENKRSKSREVSGEPTNPSEDYDMPDAETGARAAGGSRGINTRKKAGDQRVLREVFDF